MSENTILDLDSILDSTLDTVPDVPDYVLPPEGAYRLGITDAKLDKYKTKEGSQGLRIKITHTVVATVKLSNEKDIPVADGSLFTETFQADEQGLGYFKKAAKKYLKVESLDGVSIRDIMAELTGAEYDALIKIRKSSKDGKDYENVQISPQ